MLDAQIMRGTDMAYFSVKFCEDCQKAWEKGYKYSDKHNYYPNFPTYKLERKRCGCLKRAKEK